MEIICYSCGRGENPENTIEGIRHCQKVNPEWRIEMDLQLTKDGEVVLFHDYTTEKITGENFNIFDLNLNEVQNLNAGYNFQINNGFPFRNNPIKIPTLKEVCEQFSSAKLMLDIHTDNLNIIDKIIEIIEAHKMEEQVIIVSKYDTIIASFKSKKPNWIFGAATKEVKQMVYSSFFFLDSLFPIKSDVLMLPVKYGNITLLTNRVIKHVKKRKKQIWVWLAEGDSVITVETKDQYQQLQSKGVDGVFTEFPQKINKELQ